MLENILQVTWRTRPVPKINPFRQSLRGIADTLGWVAKAAAEMYRVDEQRRVLALLDEHLLDDIGIDRG